MIQCCSTDYVLQGGSVFFPAENIRVDPRSKTCSCGNVGCSHLAVAVRIANAPESDDWQPRHLRALADFLKGSRWEITRGIEKYLDLQPGSITRRDAVMNDDSYNRLFNYVEQCERCFQWKSPDDMSEDVDDVCTDCIR